MYALYNYSVYSKASHEGVEAMDATEACDKEIGGSASNGDATMKKSKSISANDNAELLNATDNGSRKTPSLNLPIPNAKGRLNNIIC